MNDAGEDDDSVRCNLYFFDIRYQKILEAAPTIELEFKFSEDFHAGIHG